METMDTEFELERRVEDLLGEELTQVLRAATEALERLAPREFQAIGTRALDLDSLMIKASAAAALPELMARFRLVSTARRMDDERYETSDWAAKADKTPAPREQSGGMLREIPQDRFHAAAKESTWVR